MCDDFDEYMRIKYKSEYRNVYINRVELELGSLVNLGKYFYLEYYQKIC